MGRVVGRCGNMERGVGGSGVERGVGVGMCGVWLWVCGCG